MNAKVVYQGQTAQAEDVSVDDDRTDEIKLRTAKERMNEINKRRGCVSMKALK